MKLKRALIRGFRSVRNQTVNFDEGFQILVGVNESGKSNVLRALSLLDPKFKATPQDIRNPLPEESVALEQQIIFEFEMSPADEKEYREKVTALFLVKDASSAKLGVRHGLEQTLKGLIALHKTPLIWIDLKSLNRHVNGYRHDLDSVAEGWYARPDSITGVASLGDGKTVNLETVKFLYSPDFPEISIDGWKPVKVGDFSIACNGVLSAKLQKESPTCVYWKYDEKYILPAQIDINEFCNDPGTCVPLRQMFMLADIASPKAAVDDAKARGTNQLRNLLERVAKRASAHIQRIWKEHKSVELKLEVNGEQIDISVVDHVNRYDFAQRSDGFKRFVSFLLVVSAQTRSDELKNALILIDEAEIGLHPSGVRYLRDELKKVGRKNLVVISTHSIHMVDRENIGRHLLVRKEKEVTEIKRADQTNIVDEEVIYQALNYSAFEVLKPQNIIFEGWRDKRLFEVALLSPRADSACDVQHLKQVGRCFLQGVKDAGRVTPILELANRDYVVVSDSDDTALEYQRKFRERRLWQTYVDLGFSRGTYLTAEDFLKAEVFIAPLSRIATQHDVTALSIDSAASRKPYTLQVSEWLQRTCQLDKKSVNEALDHIKSAIFDNLDESNIADEYFKLLCEIGKKLPTTSSNVEDPQ